MRSALHRLHRGACADRCNALVRRQLSFSAFIAARVAEHKGGSVMTTYHYTNVRGRKLFYREAGSSNSPTIVLLHGFPSSSHMFRDLIPQLADKFHVIAPDYVGFGYSDAPVVQEFEYTFD